MFSEMLQNITLSEMFPYHSCVLSNVMPPSATAENNKSFHMLVYVGRVEAFV